VSTFSYKPFVVYRIGLAILVALLLLGGVLEPVGNLAGAV
jgi:undecaprenyl-diphosphatase